MSKIYCSNCGKLIPENSNFCRFCGAPQHGAASAVYQAQAPVVAHQVTPAVHQAIPVQPTLTQDDYFIHQRLAQRVTILFYFNYLKRSIVIPGLLAAGMIFDPWLFGSLIGVYLLLVYLAVLIAYSNFNFTIDEKGYKEESGILHKKHVSLGYGQIQNVNITRSFIERIIGLARIHVETAGHGGTVERAVIGGGKTNAEAHLPGVTLKNAKKIHDLLLHKSAEAAK